MTTQPLPTPYLEKLAADIDTAFSQHPKIVPTSHLYDERGGRLFSAIMQQPEYYLTKAEQDIFQNQSKAIVRALTEPYDVTFDVIELGCGNGQKIKFLLRALSAITHNFNYLPVDIDKQTLTEFHHSLQRDMPQLKVKTIADDYLNAIHQLKTRKHPKIIVFLGSNIGNMSPSDEKQFFQLLADNLRVGDQFLLGVDLIKSVPLVRAAYNDKAGITAAFNLNLLVRLNRELGANFNLNHFQHLADYNQKAHYAVSYLQSTCDQTVNIPAIGKCYTFYQGEKIRTEISRKYNDSIIHNLIKPTPFRIVQKFVDSKHYFADYLLRYQ